MTIRDDRRARSPGPLGSFPGGIGGRFPGPLGIGSSILVSQVAVTKVVKTLKMPAPSNDALGRVAHEFTWDRFKKGVPALEDIQQGHLATCPIASILGALTLSNAGQSRIQGLIKESPGAVATVFDGIKNDTFTPPKDNKILTGRYFTVSLDSDYEVSDVLYTDDHDRGWTPFYMGSPNEALWPCMIEKAYAVKIGNYEDLDDFKKHTVNEFWKVLVGRDPQVLLVNDKTDPADIRKALAAAPKVPAIGASREDATKVLDTHGFSIVGLEGSTVEMYDPVMARKLKISLKDFQANFQAIFSGTP